MAAVTSELIKELRERTGAGLMDCKKALTEVDGDIEAAIDWLRKKGLATAAKKAGREACEGVVTVKISDDYKKGTLVEVNCETDFVAQNDVFNEFAKEVTDHIFTVAPTSLEELAESQIKGVQFADHLSVVISRIGENIVVRRFASIEAGENGVVNGYIHGNGKIGVLVSAACDSEKTAAHIRDALKDVAMHIAALNPSYLDETRIPAEDLAREEEIAKEQLRKEGKPEAMWDKIIPGKLMKFKKETCLVHQPFVKDDSKSVAQFVSEKAKDVGGTATLAEFIRFEMGEGLTKKACDFAAEVAAQLGQ
ncbi:MAG: translation elongation factor Ts [Campylobacterales bacterium]